MISVTFSVSCLRDTNNTNIQINDNTQVSTWFANARRRLKKENKMTWEPRNKTNDGHDSDDKESIAGGSEDGSSCDHVQHGNGCSTGRTTTLISMNNGTSGHSNNNSSSSNDRHRNHRSDTHVTPSVVAGTVSAVSPVTHPHYPIVKSEGLTTITDLSCTDKRSAALLTHHSIPGKTRTRDTHPRVSVHPFYFPDVMIIDHL